MREISFKRSLPCIKILFWFVLPPDGNLTTTVSYPRTIILALGQLEGRRSRGQKTLALGFRFTLSWLLLSFNFWINCPSQDTFDGPFVIRVWVPEVTSPDFCVLGSASNLWTYVQVLKGCPCSPWTRIILRGC